MRIYITKTTPSAIDKTSAIKQDYQLSETERAFYRPVIESLKPKQIPRYEDGIYWLRETYRAFPPRPYSAAAIACPQPGIDNPEERSKIWQEAYEDSISHSKRYYQEMITNLQELIKQYPDSPYYPDYQETIELVRQMQKEDESFYDKYDVMEPFTSLVLSDVNYRGDGGCQSTVPLDERINAYIHCLRYSYFYKTSQYKMEFGYGHGMQPSESPFKIPILSSAKLVQIGIPAVLNILEDRRPIIAADDTKMPAVFYRYQDAAVEILQRIFIQAKQPFPLELPEGEYFSEYLEKQTLQDRQNTINYIKKWVEESMANPPKQEEPPQGTK